MRRSSRTRCRLRARWIALSACFLAALIAATGPVTAETCASETVTARGEQSSFTWLARAKTRANWRAKVRSIPGLGDPYANFARAKEPSERCLSGPSGVICIFEGIPCRRD